jgi:hypothetical protein
MELNALQYGNPDRSNQAYLQKESYLDTLLTELQNYPFPPNESEQTKEEILELVSVTNKLSENTTDLLKRFDVYDTSFQEYIIQSLANNGISELQLEATLKSVKEDTKPLLLKVKYFYQRPRPFQLARMRNINLIPFSSVAADSPSYPSGHTFQSRVFAEVLGNQYPQFHKALHDLATDIMWSRIYMGVHYPSDCQFADYMAKIVCAHPDFREKYKI